MCQLNQITKIATTRYPNQGIDCRRYSFNTGGPMSRSRTERVQSTILGNKKSLIRCPLVISLGLDFGSAPPVLAMEKILKAEGCNDPEELRREFLTISTMYICHIAVHPNRLPVESSPRKSVLQQAVLLGLCTATFFDPTRPILWTNASLTRCLDLFNVTEFYL